MSVCLLRAAYRLDKSMAIVPRGPKAAALLGTVAHALAEEAARGRIDRQDDDLHGRLEQWWEHEVADQVAGIQRIEWLGEVPAPERWRNYERTRTRAIALIEKQIQSRDPGSPGEGVEVERRFTSEVPPLVGQIDRIEVSDGRLTIVDIKSSAATGPTMPIAYRIQLLTYAALLLAADGRRSATVAIQYLDGSRQSLAVDWDEVDNIVQSTLAMRAVLNGEGLPAPTRIPANPSPENCRYCAFQLVCPAFQRAVDPDVRLDLGFVAGSIESTSPSTGSAQLRRDSVASQAPPLRLISPLVVDQLEVGDEVTLARVRLSSTGLDIRTTWESTALIWRDGQPRIGLPAAKPREPDAYAGEVEEVAASLGSE